MLLDVVIDVYYCYYYHYCLLFIIAGVIAIIAVIIAIIVIIAICVIIVILVIIVIHVIHVIIVMIVRAQGGHQLVARRGLLKASGRRAPAKAGPAGDVWDLGLQPFPFAKGVFAKSLGFDGKKGCQALKCHSAGGPCPGAPPVFRV